MAILRGLGEKSINCMLHFEQVIKYIVFGLRQWNSSLMGWDLLLMELFTKGDWLISLWRKHSGKWHWRNGDGGRLFRVVTCKGNVVGLKGLCGPLSKWGNFALTRWFLRFLLVWGTNKGVDLALLERLDI